MGLTGSGKSTFVSRCTGADVQIGHDLGSCTQSLGIFRFNHEGRDTYLIDTPGFDDPERPDEETLGLLGHFLGVSYANRRYISGILYLHRISDNRFTGTHQRNINMLRLLCGQDAYHNIVVATTMWKSEDFQTMFQRENELLSNNNWFGSMCGPDRATYFRHAEMGSGAGEEHRSALRIVSHFFREENLGPVPLLIQHELVDAGQSLEETQAGQAILGEIGKLRQGLQKQLNDMDRRFHQNFQEQDTRLTDEMGRLRAELRQNSTANDKAHQRLMHTLPELHRQEKRRLIDQMEMMESRWAREESNSRREIAMMQQQLDRSQAKLNKSRAKAASNHVPSLKESDELRLQVAELQKKYEQVSANNNQKVAAHRNVRRVLADGTISGAVSGVVGGELFHI
ncbi:hypothetical protein ACHAP5_011033 [Fusarium lateritium]